MAVVYCALSYLGARMGTVMPQAQNGAEVISLAASIHFGTAGTVLTAAIFLIACFNVCVGLVSSIGEYFAKTLVPYGAVLIAVVSCGLSNVGLTAILSYSVPVLMALYPMGICAVAMGLVPGSQRHVLPWRVSMACVGAVSTLSALRDTFAPGLTLPLDLLPLSSMGLGWVVPGILGFVAGRNRTMPAEEMRVVALGC